jgi:hypothetical protein
VAFAKGSANQNRAKRAKPNSLPVVGGLNKRIGRPTTYQDSFPEVVKRLRLLSNTREEIAEFFGVEGNTINLWCDKYPAFNAAYAEGGDGADLEVIAALKHRARGYSHKAEKIFLDRSGAIIRAETTQHYPPDTAAAGLWLSNRRRDKWNLKSWSNNPEPGTEDAAPGIKIEGGLPDD